MKKNIFVILFLLSVSLCLFIQPAAKILNAASAAKTIALDPMLSQWVLAIKRAETTEDLLITEVFKSDYMSEIFPELKGNITKNKIDNVESLMLLNPGLIFVKTGGDHELLQLQKTGVEVVSLNFEKIEDILSGILVMGRRMRLEERAEELAAYFKNAIDSVKRAAGDTEMAKPAVYFANANIYQSFGAGMYQNILIEAAGGVSVTSKAPGAKIQVSLEELIKWDPEIIITAAFCEDAPDSILKNEKLKDIKAVKNKKIFVMPHYVTSWDMPVPESIPGLFWLLKKIHPEIKNDLRGKVREFYKLFYKIKIPDEKLEKMM